MSNMFQQLKQRFFSHKTQDEAVLTEKEVDLIRLTWSYLRNDICGFKSFGADLFIRFFQQYPDYQRQFKFFKDVPVRFSAVPMQEFRLNKKLLAHGTYVMYTIGMLVDHLEDPETLEQMLKRLARNHYRRRVAITAFELLRNSFVELLTERLGTELMNKKAATAWRKAFGYILSALDREFNALEIDVHKSGSYYQLDSTHRSVRNNMIRNYMGGYREMTPSSGYASLASQRQHRHHHRLHHPPPEQSAYTSMMNMLEARASPFTRQQSSPHGLPPPSQFLRSPSVVSSVSNVTTYSSTGTQTTTTTGPLFKKDSVAKRSFRFMFKPFKLVKKSLSSSSSHSPSSNDSSFK